jgi:leucyl/phenylalanyl-tRNA--protein transferase
MADAREDESIFLIDPERRGVLPLDGVSHLRDGWPAPSGPRRSRSASTAPSTPWSRPARPRAPGGWKPGSTPRSSGSMAQLFARGLAHSVECWRNGAMVGGLYGVSLGAAFFGESMFSTRTDASKVALVHLVARLIAGGYRAARHPVHHRPPDTVRRGRDRRADYRRRLAGLARPGRLLRLVDDGNDGRRRLAGDQPGVIDRVLQRVQARRVGVHPALVDLTSRRSHATGHRLGLGVDHDIGRRVRLVLVGSGGLAGADGEDQGLVADGLTDRRLESASSRSSPCPAPG